MVCAKARGRWREELFREEISARSRLHAPRVRLRPRRCGFKRCFCEGEKKEAVSDETASHMKICDRLLRGHIRRRGHRSLVRADGQGLQSLAKVELAILLIR